MLKESEKLQMRFSDSSVYDLIRVLDHVAYRKKPTIRDAKDNFYISFDSFSIEIRTRPLLENNFEIAEITVSDDKIFVEVQMERINKQDSTFLRRFSNWLDQNTRNTEHLLADTLRAAADAKN
jgi:hypothetical protein